MYKGILFFIIIIFVFCSSKKPVEVNKITQNNDKILWSSSRKLKWNDYEGIPDTIHSNVEASTYSEIEVVKSFLENGIPKYIIECNFIKSKSWTRSNDSYTLSHEQLHFDIYEIFARRIRKSVDSLNGIKVKNYEVYNSVFEKYSKKCDKYNDLYDSQVYFDSIQQKLWSEKITKELNELKAYKLER